MTVFEKIEQQQAGLKHTQAWMVGEQLKDICAADPSCAELVSQDLENVGMSLKKAAEKIKAYADEFHKKQKGNCVCVPPNEAERIIREFYGLPKASGRKLTVVKQELAKKPKTAPVAADLDDGLDLFDFL